MKILSIRNLLGVAAIYGAAQYAKKHGGARNAFEGLLAKVKEAASVKKDELIGRAHDASVGKNVDSATQSPSYDTGSYGGYSGDFGGGGTRRS